MGGDDGRADGVNTPASPAGPLVGRPLRACLAVLAVLAGMLALSAPALADGEVSYVFGSSFKGEGLCAVTEPGAVAVNEASGDVYVLDRATSAAARFGPSGECLGRIEPAKASKLGVSVDGIAVDNSASSPSFGDVYVVVQGGKAVAKYTPEGALLSTITNEFEQIHGVAVDTNGTLWVYHGKTAESTRIDSFTNEVTNELVSTIELPLTCPQRRGFAVGPNAESFYVGRSRENRNEGCEPVRVAVKLNEAGETATEDTRENPGEPAFYAQLDNENTTGIGVNQVTGEVFFDHETSVSAYSPKGAFVQRFGQEAGAGALQAGAGVAVDASSGNVFVYDAREGGILEVFVPKSFAPPESEQVGELADGRAWEQVSPFNKLGSSIYPITYVFGQVQASEDGNAITYTSNAPIVAAPPTNRAPEPAQNLSRRGSGSWSTEDIMPPGGDQAAGYATQTGTAYEAFSYDLSSGFVNPANRQSVTATEPLLSPEATETTPYARDLTAPASTCEPVPSSCYAALVSPLNDTAETPFGAVGGKAPILFTSATPDGHHAVLLSRVPLTAEGVAQGVSEGLYEWATGGTLKLVSVFPEGETIPGEGEPALHLGGPGENAGSVMRHAISNDGTRVVWSTAEGLGRLYLRDTAKSETIRVDLKQGVLKQPKAAHAVFQTASADGSKIFFTDVAPLTEDATTEKGEEAEEAAEERGLGDLYVCQVTEEGGKLGCALKDLTAEVEGANEEANVQGVSAASDDGNYVYFVADGSLGPNGGTGNCRLRNPVEAKEELEGLLPVGRCSLYVEHFNGEAWEAPQFIALLSSLDQNDWHGDISAGGLVRVTSRTSPNGNYFAFMSLRSITGYNNEDVNPAAEGAHDEEVFLYNDSAPTNKILCVSCKPGGEPPQGVFDTLGSGEGLGLIIDRPETWRGRWLAANIPGWTGRAAEGAVYQSRYLSDSGRLFFNSADALVPAAEEAVRKETVNGEQVTVGVSNVYEYEPNGEGSCTSETGCISLLSSGKSPQESAFLDASVGGNSVFFLTSQALTTADKDTAFDIYNARVCTTESPCLTPPGEPAPPCKEEACKGPVTSVPAALAVPPSTQAGAGNGPGKVEDRTGGSKPPPVTGPTRAQKLKKALKACKKVKKKKKRVACERTARKKYGPVKKAKK
jgi:hypothetical protein